jgi:DNA-binding winged helix-turn-helix (wHTH) protein/Tol biopolymer transport system component
VIAQRLPKSPGPRPPPFRLGDLEVLPESGEVRGPRGVERLRPLLVEILLRLAAEPGAVVRRETLLEEAWPRRMVNDEVLSRAIAELRTALGDDARAARYIETLPKIGYRLVAPVAPLEGDGPPVAGAAAASSRRGISRRAGIAATLVVLAAATAAVFLAQRPMAERLQGRLAAAIPFTSDPALEIGPRFSPDGSTLAFTLGEGSSSRIVLQSIAESSRRFVGDGRDVRAFPVFFPDGKRIAYWKRVPGGSCAIVEHDLASGAERTLVDCALSPRARFDLSRDGRSVVFAGQAHPQQAAGLWLAATDGAPPAPLTTPEAGAGDDAMPRFSPDGRLVAFFRGNESHRRPWIVELDGARAARAIGRVEGLSYGFAWLGPEGPLLAAADWLGFRALNVLDPASGEARLAGARGARFPDVGPRGEIAWESAAYTANLWQLAPGREARVRWRSTRHTSQPELSPDGARVAFASNRDGTDALYVAALDGEPRRVAFGEEYRYMRPHWTADGRAIHAVRFTLRARGEPVRESVRIPLDGGAAEVLTLPGPVNDVRESRDGRWLYWGVLEGDAMRLWRAPRGDPARAERLPLPVVAQYNLGDDWLVYALPQQPRLTACRLPALACAPLPVELAAADVFNWALGSASLYLRAPEGIARIDLASGRRLATLALPAGGSIGSLAASRDEAHVFVAREEGPAIDLMLAR